LVASQWVLTAAHCVVDFEEYLGIIGNHFFPWNDTMYLNLNTTTHTGPLPRKLLQFSKSIPHPAYTRIIADNDVALLKLSEPLDINIYTPLCLPCKNDNFLGKKAWAMGWGLNDHINNAFSDVLQEVSLSVVSNDKCNRQFEFDLPGLGFNFAI